MLACNPQLYSDYIFIYFYYYVATTLIYYITYLRYWNMKKNQYFVYLFVADVGNIYQVLKYTPIIFFFIFLLLCHYHIDILYYIFKILPEILINIQHSTFCVFVCCRSMSSVSNTHHVILNYNLIMFLYISIAMSLTTS